MQINWKHVSIAILLGVLLGAALGRWSMMGHRHHRRHDGKHFERKFKMMSKKLKLNPEQEPRVRKIFEDSRRKMEGLHEKFDPQFKEIRKNASQEIKKVLNPDQQVLFDKWEERRKKRWKKKEKKHSLKN